MAIGAIAMHTFDYIAIGLLVVLALAFVLGMRATKVLTASLRVEQDCKNPNGDHDDRHRENYRPDLV